MSVRDTTVVRNCKVGTFECTFTWQPTADGLGMTMQVEWSPAVPHALTPTEMSIYLKARNAVIADATRIAGITVAVIG